MFLWYTLGATQTYPGRKDEEKNAACFGFKTLAHLGDKFLGPWIIVKRRRKRHVLNQTVVVETPKLFTYVGTSTSISLAKP
jgi:hypothetical protein